MSLDLKRTIRNLLGVRRTLDSSRLTASQTAVRNSLLNENSLNIIKNRPIFTGTAESNSFELNEYELNTSHKDEVILADEAAFSLSETSIFRQLGRLIKPGVSLDGEVCNDIFRHNYVIFKDKSVESYEISTPISHPVPVQQITFSIKATKDKNLLSPWSKRIGSFLGNYENKIFATMLEAYDQTSWLINKDCPIETVFRACHRCIFDGNYGFYVFLPSSTQDNGMAAILLDELSAHSPSTFVKPVYIPDLILKMANTYSVVVPTTTDIRYYQPERLHVVGLTKGSDLYYQCSFACGYSISNLTKSYVCSYNNV